MSEPSSNPTRPDPASPSTSRRIIPDWEYKTAYIELFQVRVPIRLHDRLCDWAKEERKLLGDLVVELVEEAFHGREGTSV